MANANKKKHRKDKRERVNAAEFAKGFVGSVGNKDEAHVKATLLAEAAKKAAIPDQSLVNFWTNIAGHINKVGL